MLKNKNTLLFALAIILLISTATSEQVIVMATNGTTTNQTTTNTTNSTTNTSAYCNNSNQTGCVLTQEQLIQIITDNTVTFTPVVIDSSGNAILCPTSCISCTSGSQCSVCYIGYALDSSKRCVPCKGCKTCSSTNSTNCTSCYLPQQLNAATNLCDSPVGCTNSACQTCSNSTYCLTCYKGYSLYNNDCKACIYGCEKCTISLTSCDPDGCGGGYIYFANSRTGINQCLECTAGCVYCSTENLNNCVGCIQGYFPSIDNTKIPAANTCTPCFTNCKTCTTSTSCTACKSGYKLTSDSLRCVLLCDSTCNTCVQNKPTNCLSCFAGYIYNSTQQSCTVDISSCNQTGTCIGCPLSQALISGYCHSCTYTEANCKGCQATNLAVCSLCISGYYLTQTNTCTKCNTQCTVCLNQYACSSCQTGYYLKTQTAQVTGTCVACDDPCASCFQKSTVCLTCVSGFTLQGRKCKGKINVGFSIAIDINYATWATISSALADFITQICLRFSPKFNFRRLIISNLIQGSTTVQGSASVDSAAEATSVSSTIATQAVGGVLVGGSPIIGSSTTINGVTSSSSSANLGLILGVSIPLLLIVIAILVVISVKLSKNQKYYDYDGVNKDFVSDTEKGVQSESV